MLLANSPTTQWVVINPMGRPITAAEIRGTMRGRGQVSIPGHLCLGPRRTAESLFAGKSTCLNSKFNNQIFVISVHKLTSYCLNVLIRISIILYVRNCNEGFSICP